MIKQRLPLSQEQRTQTNYLKRLEMSLDKLATGGIKKWMADKPKPWENTIPDSALGNYPPVPDDIDLYSEAGRSGLYAPAGYVREEILPELSGRQWRRVAK